MSSSHCGSISRRRFVQGLAASAMVLAACQSEGRAPARISSRVRLTLGLVPLLSSGTVYIGQAKGYFDRVGLDLEIKTAADGALLIQLLTAGEVQLTAATANAGFFNGVAKGANYKIVADRGQERRGRAYLVTVATKSLVDEGVLSVKDFVKLKGRPIHIQAPGSIDQYEIGNALQQAGLDPVRDVDWQTGLAYPDLAKGVGAGQILLANMPINLAATIEPQGAKVVMIGGDDVTPNVQLAMWIARNDLIQSNREAAVRFVMANIQAGREFNAAAENPDAHPDIVDILVQNKLMTTDVLKKIAPRWTYFAEDGLPNVDSVLAQQDYWADVFKVVERKSTREQLFDLSIAQEANDRLVKQNPFV